MRRPFVGTAKISGDTATHAAYGVGPATDYGNLGAGAFIVAPAGCTIQQYQSSTGGDSLLLTGDSWQMNFQHLRSRGGNGRYAEGAKIAELAGWDDNHGSAWDGPHLHGWVVGPRSSIEEFLAALGYRAGSLGQIVSATLTSTAGNATEIINPETEDDMIVKRIRRDGIGEFYLFVSPTIVSLSRELSGLKPDDRAFEDRVATAMNDGRTPDYWDETPNGSWYLRNQLAAKVAGMPTDYPLTPTNPYRAGTVGPIKVEPPVQVDVKTLAAALADTLATRLAS